MVFKELLEVSDPKIKFIISMPPSNFIEGLFTYDEFQNRAESNHIKTMLSSMVLTVKIDSIGVMYVELIER